MNKIIASVGLVALGAANVQAQTPLSGPPTKWWNVQATVRGFYDDNLNTVRHPGSSDRVWGGEITPKVGIELGNDQTSFTADYTYAFLYYDKRPNGNTERYDQDHTFNAALSHSFNERYSVHVRDSFVVGQEPDALRRDAAFHTPFRVAGDNIVDYGGINFTAELTPVFGLDVGYNFAWFDYKDSFSPVPGGKNVQGDGTINPSVSGALDRIEQSPYLSFLWHVRSDTTASLGYTFSDLDYTANEPIVGNETVPGSIARSGSRNYHAHTLHVGLDHVFRPDFYGSAQVGASYYDYYNLDTKRFGPYAQLSLTYVYMPESSLQAGFQEGRAASDFVGGGDKQDLVRDAETSVFFLNLRHRIVPNLFANLSGSYQHSQFEGGADVNGKEESFYEFGGNLEYQFNPHFSVHAGYDFDHLDSQVVDRSYTRNKVYIGATASY